MSSREGYERQGAGFDPGAVGHELVGRDRGPVDFEWSQLDLTRFAEARQRAEEANKGFARDLVNSGFKIVCDQRLEPMGSQLLVGPALYELVMKETERRKQG